VYETVRDNDNLKSHKYVCITTYHPDTKSNPNPHPNPNPTTKQHVIVNIELNIVTCPTYPDKCIRDNVVASSVPTSVVTVLYEREKKQSNDLKLISGGATPGYARYNLAGRSTALAPPCLLLCFDNGVNE